MRLYLRGRNLHRGFYASANRSRRTGRKRTTKAEGFRRRPPRTPAESPNETLTRFGARGDEPRETEFDLQGQRFVGPERTLRPLELVHSSCQQCEFESRGHCGAVPLPTALAFGQPQGPSADPGFERNHRVLVSAAASPTSLMLPEPLGGGVVWVELALVENAELVERAAQLRSVTVDAKGTRACQFVLAVAAAQQADAEHAGAAGSQ